MGAPSEQPTVRVPAMEQRSISVAPTATNPSLIASSPANALLLEEVERSRAMIRLSWVASWVFAATMLALSGEPWLEWTLLVCIVASSVFSVVLERQFRDPTKYTIGRMTILAIATASVGQLVVLYFGVFSGATMLMLLGLYFFSRTERAGSAVLVYLTIALLQVISVGLILGGVIDDPALLGSPDLSMSELVIAQCLIQGLYFSAFLIARSTRRSTLRAMDSLQSAIRLASKRAAQLEEARQDLDRALRVGGAGHYTGRVVGDYEIGVLIGHGAMGEVYEGAHTATGDVAAVKLLHPHILGDERHVERFLREVRAASAIKSQHVVRVFDSSEPGAELPYLVMERLEGHDLAHYLREHHQLKVDRVIELVYQIGEVIDLAWQQQIVHRDLKPHNLYLANDGDRKLWKVLDFGIAFLADHGGTLTQGGAIGTPGYMSPEQARGIRVDARSDVYALGTIAYRCLTGRPAYTGPDVPAVLYDVVHTMPERPSILARLPEQLDDVFAVVLAKRADDRFQTGAELAAALAAAASGKLDESIRERAAKLLAKLDWLESI